MSASGLQALQQAIAEAQATNGQMMQALAEALNAPRVKEATAVKQADGRWTLQSVETIQ